jgi:putative DNA primase/helicase
MNDKAEDLAFGHWKEILQFAGIDEAYFSGNHGPCPICGGKDRYRWSRKHSDAGLWVCSGCTDDKWANGFKMLMEVRGLNFREAADFVREYFNGSAPRAQPHVCRPAPDNDGEEAERNLKRMNAIWTASREIAQGDPVDLYLQRRVPGLDFVPEMVRFHPALDYWAPPDAADGRPVLLGRFPAMVAKAFDPHGNFVQIHKTYLTLDGQKAQVPVVKKMERGIGAKAFAVPMMRVEGNTLGISEGLESGLAGAMLRRIPVWPCLSGPSLAAFDIPDHLLQQIERVVIFADHDELKPLRVGATQTGPRYRRAGSHYAEQLSTRVRAHGKRVLVVKPSRVGFDMANHWIETHAREVLAA